MLSVKDLRGFSLLLTLILFLFVVPSAQAATITTCPGEPAITMFWSSSGCTTGPTITSSVFACNKGVVSSNPTGSAPIPNGTTCDATINCSNATGNANPVTASLVYDPSLTWNGSSCVGAGSCTGSIPANATSWNDPPSSGTVAYSYSATNTATSCQFACASGYTWNGSACVGAAPFCGDSITNGSEQCDLGTGFNGACPSACDFSCNYQSCPVSVTIICPASATIPVGSTQQFRGYTGTGITCSNLAGATDQTNNFPTWTSYNSSMSVSSAIVSVNNSTSKGLATGVAGGVGHLSFTALGQTGYASVNVVAPDLTPNAPPQDAATVGTGIQFTSLISNTGGAGTGSSFSNFFQICSTAAAATQTCSGTLTDLTSTTMAALAAGANNTATSPSYTFGSAGTSAVRVCADKTDRNSTGVITEWNASGSGESNNCSSWIDVTVSAAASPTLTCSRSNPPPGSSPYPTGTQFVYTATLTNGGANPVFTFTDPSNGDQLKQSPDNTYTITYNIPNTYRVQVIATGISSPVSCDPAGVGVTVANPSVSCSRSPSGSNVPTGQLMTFTATPSGGAGPPYTFKDGAGVPLQSGNSNVYQATYSIPGNYTVKVNATGAAAVAFCDTAFTVDPACGALSMTLDVPSRVKANTSFNGTWSATGVTGSCQVTGSDGYVGPVVSASSCNVAANTFTRSITGQTTYTLTCDGTPLPKVVNILPVFETF